MSNHNCEYEEECIMRLSNYHACDKFTPEDCPMASLYKRIERLESNLIFDEDFYENIYDDVYELNEGDIVK